MVFVVIRSLHKLSVIVERRTLASYGGMVVISNTLYQS